MNPKIEKLGAFYLGRPWNAQLGKTESIPVMLDSRHLVTHAVCLGMTGSGKTGLGINILEEAAIDGIPAIVIDPKGDMTNLALTFPQLRPEDFEPWIDPESARQKEVSTAALAASTAETWRKGLQDWEQDGQRVALFKNSCSVHIFTPGNSAHAPLSILKSLDPPPPHVISESDLYSDSISGTVTSLLTLLEIDADPLRSREHILLTSILDTIWKKGESTDLPGLIKLVQNPPITQVGVFALDTFFPLSERMKLAMALNNLLASPDFSSWLQGPPMQIDQMLYSPEGLPRITIVSLAHLDDRERMFVVSLLLNRIITWMRSQNGTSSLRALLYMDELFGFLPPVAQPPSKRPLLTLLKQARAFGLGLVLCTQNPVDIDYKALSNIGIWMIGRLQTEQDRNRLLDGLKENPSLGGKQGLGELIASLQKRVFLMHNVHEEGPYLFQTRWCLSYLAGPLTRDQLRKLSGSNEDLLLSQKSQSQPPSTDTPSVSPVSASTGPNQSVLSQPPLLPPGIQPVYLGISPALATNPQITYHPAIVAYGSIFFSDSKYKLNTEQKFMHLLQASERSLLLNWDDAIEINCPESELRPYPQFDAGYSQPPGWMTQAKEYQTMQNGLRDWLFRKRKLSLFRSPSSQIVSLPGEEERDFRVRLSQQGRENRDTTIDKLRSRYSPKIQRLQNQINSAEIKLSREKEQVSASRMDTAVSVGSTLLSAFLGRKLISQSSISRASTSIRRAQRIGKESQDVGWAEQQLQKHREELAALEEQLNQEIETLQNSSNPLDEPLESIEIFPKKLNISVRLLTLCWLPYSQSSHGGMQPAWFNFDQSQ